MRWNAEQTESVKKWFRNEDWGLFHETHPEVTYDSWETKRRRINKDGGIEQELVAVPAGGSYVGPSIAFWDLETTYSSQPRLLSGASTDGFGELQVWDQREYGGREDWLNDRDIAVAIRDYLEDFDIICGWNSKLFDVPVLNGRLARWGERPLRAQMHLDLMYYAGGQFMRIGSKALDSVSKFFDSPNRKTPLSPLIWDKADHGDEDAMDLIIEHNVADVFVTRDVYPHLRLGVRTIHRAG